MWKTLRLGDICNISIGKTPSRSDKKYWDINKQTNNVWLSIADLTSNKSRYIADSKEYVSDEGARIFKPVPKETLVMSFKLSIGKLAFTQCELRTNEAIAALPIKDESLVSKEFLYHYLSSLDWDFIAGNDVKVKGKTLNKKKLNDLSVLLPSLPEQQRIVSKLDTIFDEINKTINACNLTINHLKSLNSNTSREIFKDLRNNEKIYPINDACEAIFAGGDAPRDSISDTRKGKYLIPVYANAMKNKGLYGYTDSARVNKPSVTVAARGSGTGYTQIRYEPFLPIVRLLVLIPNDEKVTVEFLKYAIENLDVFSSGSAIPQLTVPMMKRYEIPVPTLSMQQSLTKKLDSLQENVELCMMTYNKKIESLHALKTAMLYQELQTPESEAA